MLTAADPVLRRAPRHPARPDRLGAGAIHLRRQRRRRDGEAAVRPVLHEEHVARARSADCVRNGEDRHPQARRRMSTGRRAVDEPIVNALTIDVEDYFHVSVFDGLVPRTPVGSAREPRLRQHRAPARGDRRDQGHVLRARLGRGAVSAAGPHDRRRRPRDRLARVRAPAGLRPDAARVPRGCPQGQGRARGRPAARRSSAIARRATRSPRSRSGRSTS